MHKRSSYQIFSSVFIALFLREIQTRFGTKKLGYFWAIFDAMLAVMVFSSLKSAIATNSMPGIDFPVFLATGFLAFFLWKNIVSKSMSAFSANAALFNYVQVKPIDTVLTRFFIELLISIMAILVFLCIGLYFDFDIRVENFNMVVLAVVWLALFGVSLGLLSAIIGSFYVTYTKVLTIILMPLLFLSALMYTVESLPPTLREIILYNPLVHFIEMIHGNYFSILDTKYVDYEYMFYWTFIPMFLALYFYEKAEKKMISSR